MLQLLGCVSAGVQVWKRSMPNSDFVAIKSKASLAVSPQALFEVLTPGDIEIVRQVCDRQQTLPAYSRNCRYTRYKIR